MPIALVAVSVAMTAYGAYKQNQANKASAALAKETAAYNASVDLAEGKQIEMDTQANVRASREEGQIYMSRQKAGYASAGVLSSGSPLAVEATTAGKIEQRIAQDRINAGREYSKRAASAKVGIMYGDARASAIKTQNQIQMLQAGSKILSTVGGAYNAGTFASAGGGGASDSAASMLAAGAPAGVASRYGT